MDFFSVLCFIFILSLARAHEPFLSRAHYHFNAFLRKYRNDKSAHPQEVEDRFQVFQNNLRTILDLNKAHNSSAVWGVTKYADWTPETLSCFSGKK